MKQLFRRLSPVLLAACLISAAGMAEDVYAEDERIAAELEGGGSFPVGKTFSVTLSYEGEELAEAGAEVSYDEDLLEFISCDGDEVYCDERGMIRLLLTAEEDEKDGAGKEADRAAGDGPDGAPSALSCKIRFQAIAEGEGFITATTIRLTDEEGREYSVQTRSVKVTLTEKKDAVGAPDEAGAADTEKPSNTAADENGEKAHAGSEKTAADKDKEKEDTVFRFELFCVMITASLLAIILLSSEIKKKRKRLKRKRLK